MISLIIPSLLGFDELNRACIDSYQETSETDVEVVLVEENAPFGPNVNKGIKDAKGDILCVVNNDSIGMPGWDRFIREALRGDSGIASLTPRADCGWGFAATRQLWDRVGLLDENLVNSYEDYDFFIRAALLGYTRILADKYYAVHTGGITVDTLWGPVEEQSKERLKACFQNRDYMSKKWPGIQFDAIPLAFWVYNGVEIMKEWSREHAQAS